MALLVSWHFCAAQEVLKPDTIAPQIPKEYQELPDSLNIIGTEPIKKGDITLYDGNVIRFSDLRLSNDTVFFLSKKSSASSLALSEIKGITKTKSSPGIGALSGGIAGLFGGLLVSGIVNPRRTTVEWIDDQIDGEDDVQDIRKEDVPYMAIGTAAGAAIGTLVGLGIKKSTVVYFHNKTVDVLPVIGFGYGEKPAVMLTLKFAVE
jgi:hypothetical protein